MVVRSNFYKCLDVAFPRAYPRPSMAPPEKSGEVRSCEFLFFEQF